MLGGQVVIGRRHEAARTAAAGSGKYQLPPLQENKYQLPPLQEKEWIADSMTAIEQATGVRPVGYNNYWIRPGVNTLEILQELGFTDHIDHLSAGEPFLQSINGQPFATVPYLVRLNDIASLNFPALPVIDAPISRFG